jgi:hypothetical protein
VLGLDFIGGGGGGALFVPATLANGFPPVDAGGEYGGGAAAALELYPPGAGGGPFFSAANDLPGLGGGLYDCGPGGGGIAADEAERDDVVDALRFRDDPEPGGARVEFARCICIILAFVCFESVFHLRKRRVQSNLWMLPDV